MKTAANVAWYLICGCGFIAAVIRRDIELMCVLGVCIPARLVTRHYVIRWDRDDRNIKIAKVFE